MIALRQTLLPGAGAAGDQQVGHGGQVHGERVARHVFAEEQRDLHLLDLAVGLLHDLAQSHDLAGFVGHFDAHRVLARDRRDDPDAGDAQRDGQVVRQAGDPRQPQSGLQFDFVLGDHRARFDFHHLDVEPEVGERAFQDLGLAAHLFGLRLEADFVRFDQQFQRRQLVVVCVAGQAGFVQTLHHLLPFVLAAAVPHARTGGLVFGRRRRLLSPDCGPPAPRRPFVAPQLPRPLSSASSSHSSSSSGSPHPPPRRSTATPPTRTAGSARRPRRGRRRRLWPARRAAAARARWPTPPR